MPYLQLIFLCFITLLTQSPALLADEALLPPDQAFKISAKAVTADQLEISWDIAEGYYLYRNKMQFISKTELIPTVTPVFRRVKPSTMKILAMLSFTETA